MLNILSIFWEKIENLLKKQFFLILGISIFNYTPYGINKYFLGKYLNHSFFYKSMKLSFHLLDFFMLILGIALIISFINEKLKNKILKIFFCISFVLFLAEIFLLKVFKTLINPSILQIILESNKSETIEFIQTYLNIKSCFFIIITFILIFLAIKFLNIKKDIFLEKLFKSNILKFIFIIYPLFSIFNNISNIETFSLGRTFLAVQTSRKNIKEYREAVANINKNNITILSNNSRIKNIIFIVGESTTRNHMSLYGYQKETNPLLKQLEKEGNLYKFTDTISPHSHTIPVIKKLFTFCNYESTKEWYNYNNIIDIMNKAGYNTYWFSNQESSGIYGNIAAALASKAKTTIFNKIRDSEDNVAESYDEEIVVKSKKYINTDKNFIVYHLMGTHSSYKNRYPSSFDKFKNEKNKVAEYDNAVLYNDYVINKIITEFKNKEAIIIYVSDHGEEVLDFRNFIGHTENNPSRYMIEIPFLIYVSDKFKENYPEIINKIETSLNNPYMTDDLIHTILDITQIKTLDFDDTRSIINPKFNKMRKRIFFEKNYDEYWKGKN